MNFEHKTFSSTHSKTAHLATMLISLSFLLLEWPCFGVANLISRKAYFSGYAHKNELVIGNIDIFAGYYFFAREKILSEIKTFCSIAGQQAQCLISMAFVGFIKSRGVR
jgi:hypothetical protein